MIALYGTYSYFHFTNKETEAQIYIANIWDSRIMQPGLSLAHTVLSAWSDNTPIIVFFHNLYLLNVKATVN